MLQVGAAAAGVVVARWTPWSRCERAGGLADGGDGFGVYDGHGDGVRGGRGPFQYLPPRAGESEHTLFASNVESPWADTLTPGAGNSATGGGDFRRHGRPALHF